MSPKPSRSQPQHDPASPRAWRVSKSTPIKKRKKNPLTYKISVSCSEGLEQKWFGIASQHHETTVDRPLLESFDVCSRSASQVWKRRRRARKKETSISDRTALSNPECNNTRNTELRKRNLAWQEPRTMVSHGWWQDRWQNQSHTKNATVSGVRATTNFCAKSTSTCPFHVKTGQCQPSRKRHSVNLRAESVSRCTSHQGTRGWSVSMSTPVWDPLMFKPLNGWASPNSTRHATCPFHVKTGHCQPSLSQPERDPAELQVLQDALCTVTSRA